MPENKYKAPQLRVKVYRHLNNREGDPIPTSPEGLELHQRRAAALHAIFDEEKSLRVIDWDYTDAPESHEYVLLLLELVSRPEVQQVLDPATGFVRDVLANATGDLVAAAVVYILTKLRKPQKEYKVQEVIINDNQGKATVSADPKPDGRAVISVSADGANSVYLDADANERQVQRLRTKTGLVKEPQQVKKKAPRKKNASVKRGVSA